MISIFSVFRDGFCSVYVYMLFFVILIAALIVGYLYFQTTEEDSYQNHIHENLDSDAPIIKFVFHEKEYYREIKDHILAANFFETHSNELHKLGCKFTLDKNDILNGNSSLFKVDFDDQKQRMFMKFDHSRLGGSCFLKLKAYALKDEPIQIPSTNLLALGYIPVFWRDMRTFLNSPFVPLPRHNNTQPIRYSLKKALHVPRGTNTRAFVLHHVLMRLFACIKPGRPLRILIPVPFRRFNTVNNNIGAIFLLFNGEKLDDFARDFEDKKYMAGVTNSLVVSKLNKLAGEQGNIREKIDIVIASLYSNMDRDYDLYWSTQLKPTEAIYVGTYSRVVDGTVYNNTAFTCSTSQFSPDKEMKAYSCSFEEQKQIDI